MVVPNSKEHQLESRWYSGHANKWVHDGIFNCFVDEFEFEIAWQVVMQQHQRIIVTSVDETIIPWKPINQDIYKWHSLFSI